MFEPEPDGRHRSLYGRKTGNNILLARWQDTERQRERERKTETDRERQRERERLREIEREREREREYCVMGTRLFEEVYNFS